MGSVRLAVESKNPSHSQDRVLQSIEGILGLNKLCALATVGSNIRAYVNTAFYAYDSDLRLFILTPPQTQHGQNLAQEASAAIAIYDSHQVWDAPKQGLQMFGTMERTKGTELQQGFDLYAQRYPPLLRLVSVPEGLTDIDSRFYTFRPGRIRIFDEPRFGTEVWIDCDVL